MPPKITVVLINGKTFNYIPQQNVRYFDFGVRILLSGADDCPSDYYIFPYHQIKYIKGYQDNYNLPVRIDGVCNGN